MTTVRQWIAGGVLGGMVAGLACWRQALTADGGAAAAVLGCVTFARGGVTGVATLLTFFGSSTALSRLGEPRKESLPLAQAKGARRDIWQVLANGGAACVCFALGQPKAATGALAAAAADTWATEVGLLAHRQPRMITTLRAVAPGTSGGVTPEGLLASLGGAAAVGLAAGASGGGWRDVRRAAIAGVGGSVVDSLLGATLQAVYRCPRCEVLAEAAVHQRCGTPTVHMKGLTWMNNDVVNLLATVAGAVFARF